ncbi:MAG TPA: CDP-archaeol synthase [Gaiellaceae bacterium]|nr:CDP-archaeol synthase [Gaiellaceae bacterium]
MSNLISRLLVGAIGLPLVLGFVWLGDWWLTVLVLVAALVAVHEFVTVARPLRPLAPALYLGVAFAIVLARTSGPAWMLGGWLATFVFAFAASALAKTRAPSTVAIGATILGAGWIGFGFAHLLLLRDFHHHGRLLAFTVLLTVWAADTFAYFGGRLIGRHKLAPTLSPGKTWEGFVIGALAGIFVSFVALYDTRHTYLPVWKAIVLGVVVVLAAVVGDLFESMLKRDMQVKDTGRLLGGHGGLIDRVDALLFAGPAAYYLVLGFGHG